MAETMLTLRQSYGKKEKKSQSWITVFVCIGGFLLTDDNI